MHVERRHGYALALAIVLQLAVQPLHAAETRALRTAIQSIDTADLGRHVDVLADDTFEGREAGSRGGRAAGGYLVQVLQEYELQGAGEDGGFFQLFGAGYRNVLGMLEGRDPELKHEFILIGGHYDHVGYGNSRNSFGPTGYIHNGADDNASGVAGILELIQAFTMLAEPPRRSILFAFWDGEEKGLLGSKHWTAHPTIGLKNVVLALNCDMIGRMESRHVEVYGARTGAGLRQLVARGNADLGLDLDFIWDVKPNSDHYSFFERRIPFLMLHTGEHEDYHRPSDDPEKINRQGMQAVTRLIFRVADELAESDAIPAYRPASRHESNFARSRFERSFPPDPPRLGVSWASDVQGELQITRVALRSAAAAAGFQVGDRILKFDGRVVNDGDQLRMLVLAAPSATQAVVRRPGQEQPLQLDVALPGNPVHIGISWIQDRADPAMVILTRVIPGSAASHAGLAPRDRVYAVSGRSFTDGDEFGQIIRRQDGPVELLVERRGKLRTFTLSPPRQLIEAEPVHAAAQLPAN